ncbi:RHS repeat-associated core domain-containing protein [Pseudomonas sp. AL03]|uniref:RHS repeat domain-containing protein n=1 Tax=Pseudomonas sp. AL03 TaxID=3042230 RepID=UPI00249CCC74|nr:RHS repeat-associated core domain-containing protein [Pseudomonas sp. AL03]MDI3271039.1 RHS repeat-associated core domain-containing protein [Pseudomonas sp. AL03]
MGMHHKTPRLSVVDPRGLPIRSVDYWREVEGVPTQARINRTFHDVAGRAVEQWDPRLWALKQEEPLAPANLMTVFSLSGNALCIDSVDAGWQLNLPGLGSEVLLSWDSRGTHREIEYDDLLRPGAVFEQGANEPRRCVERMEYGSPHQGSQEQNQYGQLIRHDDPAGKLNFTAFSITGNCIEQTRLFEGDESNAHFTTRWRFSPQDEVLEQVDAKQNRQAFEFTLDGRLRESRSQLKGQNGWQTLVSDIRYNAGGQVEHEVAGNEVQTILMYCPEDGRLMERRAYSDRAGLLQHLVHKYDRIGNVLNIEDKALPVRYFNNQRIDPISCFVYDSLSQLIEAFGWEAGSANQGPASVGRVDAVAVSNYHQIYSYDEGGNLLKLTHVGAQSPGRELKIARYSNRCLPYRNGVPPTEVEIAAAFDDRGNLLELDKGRSLIWDLRNQLQSVSPVKRASGLNDRESYVYDGGGQRVRKIRSLQTNARTVVAEVRYLPGLELRTDSGTGKVLQVITAQAGLNSVRVLHWEIDPPSGVTNDQYRYSLVDHLNSCTLELADDARIISRETYYPFGETAWFAGPNDTDGDYKTVRYSGKERDATGLYYYGFRYYIPWLQRWLNPDPAGNVDGLNFYAMVINNPVTFWDANGLAKTGNYEVDVGLSQKLMLKAAMLTSKISVFDKASGKYKASNDFKVVEVGMESKYLVSGDEVKKNLRDYKDIYSRRVKALPQRKVGGEESNSSLGESVSGYMLRSANDTFVEESNTLDAPNYHPDAFVERRFFAVLKSADKNKLPEQRKIFGLTELSTFTEKGKTEVTVVQTVVHPDTQGAEERPGEEVSNDASMGRLPQMRGVGTYLTVQSLDLVSKGTKVTKVITEAINPRSAKIASKFGAKWVKKR